MSKDKLLCLLIVLFCFIYSLNYLTPLSFGDDYVYSFVWQGHSEYVPLTEGAVRLSSLSDLFISQWSHYFTWSGRTVSHTIAQLFLWLGKDIFNVFNALIAVLLILEIYWCSNKGCVTFDIKPGRLIWVFLGLWIFTPGFSPVFFWLSGACNYLWTAVFLLGFLLPYVRKYYYFEEKITNHNWAWLGMFLFGIIAGWSNENSVCWIILALIVFIYANRKKSGFESWMFAGLAGLVIGYALLMFAPGNVARLQAETNASTRWVTGSLINTNLQMLAAVFLFQFLLWYFCLRSFFILQQQTPKSEAVNQEKVFVQVLCILSFAMTAMMLFSPNFPPRSSFPGTVQLIIATTALLRIQEEYSIEIIKKNAKIFLCGVASVYFMVSATATFYGFYDYHRQVQNLLTIVSHSGQAKEEIVTVSSITPVSETVANLSGLHILFYEMSENANDWRNVAFSRYYGIKGIRMIKPSQENK